jgi:hypothetical protein
MTDAHPLEHAADPAGGAGPAQTTEQASRCNGHRARRFGAFPRRIGTAK